MNMHLDVRTESFGLKQAFVISRGSRAAQAVVHVELSDGIHTGHGEAVPTTRYGETAASVVAAIEQHRRGIELTTLEHHMLLEQMPLGAARNAIDCAFLDLKAKRTGQPVWRLLGLPRAPGGVSTAYTLSLGSPERMGKEAGKQAWRPLLKLKLGEGDSDLARVEAVRAAAPSAEIIVDANEGWRLAQYREILPELQKLGVTMVEQPIPASEDDALCEVPRSIALCADESCHDRCSLERLVGLYDMINIKLDKTGGLTEGLALRQAARERGFEVMIGCMLGTSLAMAPAMLLAQEARYVDLDGPLLLSEDREHPLAFSGSTIAPPSAMLWG
jgi:L-alanine-DL-glutamate epimerase-like enolase superfamily enzyme